MRQKLIHRPIATPFGEKFYMISRQIRKLHAVLNLVRKERKLWRERKHLYRMRSEIERTRLPSFDWTCKKKLREKSLPEFKCPAASKVPKRFCCVPKRRERGTKTISGPRIWSSMNSRKGHRIVYLISFLLLMVNRCMKSSNSNLIFYFIFLILYNTMILARSYHT